MATKTGNVFYLWLIIAQIAHVLCSDARTMSVVIGKGTGDAEEFVQIISPPQTIDNGKLLTVEYLCTSPGVVAVELYVGREDDTAPKVYRKYWKCVTELTTQTRKVRLRMPDSLGYKPGLYNKVITFGSKPILRAFIMKDKFRKVVPTLLQFGQAEAGVSYDVHVTLPYSRPTWRPYKACAKWKVRILQRISALNNAVCPYEYETVQLVHYPAVFNGLHYGIYRRVPAYQDKDLEKKRIANLLRPGFTVAMWLYIIDYCPHHQGIANLACGIFMHVNWNNTYNTPLMLVDSNGNPRVEGVADKGRRHLSHIVHFKLPKHQWIRTILSFSDTSWRMEVNYGENNNMTYHTGFDYGEKVIFDDTAGDFIIGGNDALVPSFVGYVGQATLYRRRVLTGKQMPMPSPYHPMFELGLTRREEKCGNFLSWLDQQILYYRGVFKQKLETKRDICQPYFLELLEPKRYLQCPVRSATRPKKFRILNTFIRQSVKTGAQIREETLAVVAEDILNNATLLIEEELENVPEALPLLKQAACLGNYDAMYMLSVILNNGLRVKANEIEAQAYLMLGAVDGHRLSSLALAHKHMIGVDGAPLDKELAYFYYKYVAGKTRDDRETHKETDVLTESIRLTDEHMLGQQTDEDGDVFLWLKHQAQAGVASAQIQMARALFWGSQGLRRNLNAAMEVFRAGADQGNPEMMYDYGINVYNGKAAEKNKTVGVEYMKKAAAKNNPAAINALGWIMMKEKKYEEAVTYFNRAYKLGDPNSAYYLGHMLLEGYHPHEPQNWDKAFQFFEFAAVRGHHDSGALFAYIAMKGTAKMRRNLVLAAEWVRFVAEKNPAVGGILRKGLHAFRNGNIPVAFFYYLLAADSGLEVASFNLAWLCDENKEGLVTHMEKECTWRHFNISTQREVQQVDPYALIKMGDYFWYGCQGHRDIEKAASYYASAASKGDPHALFNLAIMVEEGVKINNATWAKVGVPQRARGNNITLLQNLYYRCKESRKTEAFLPCSIALYKIQLLDVWTRYHIWMKLSSIVGVSVVAMTTVLAIYHHFKTRRPVDDII